jgi:chemotaxis protein histidine kinase CheA
MALEKAGVVLVAENYSDYIQKLRNIQSAHQSAFSRGAATLRQYQQNVEGTQRSVSGLAGAFGVARGALSSLAVVAGAFIAIDLARHLYQFGKAAGEIAMRNQTLLVSLMQVGKGAGYTDEQIRYAEAAVRKMGITTQSARQSLVRMAQAEIDWVYASKLARIAQDAAVIGNINSSEAFERLIYGIQTAEPLILRHIGISVNFGLAYQKLAARLGKGVDQLTETEKATARVNAVIEAGARIAGTYEAAMGTAGKQQTSLARYIEETQYNLGKMLLPLNELRIELETAKWKSLQELTKGLASWESPLRSIITALKGIGQEADNTRTAFSEIISLVTGMEVSGRETLWSWMGRGAHDLARAFMELQAILGAFFSTASEAIGQFLSRAVLPFVKVISGDFAGAVNEIKNAVSGVQESFFNSEKFVQRFQSALAQYRREMPELWQDYSRLGDVAETSLERAASAAERYIESLRQQQSEMSAQIEALKKVEHIQKDFDRAAVRAAQERDRALVRLLRNIEKQQLDAAKRREAGLRDLEVDAARKRAELAQESHQEYIRAVEDSQKTIRRLTERFQLEQLQSQRRYSVQERRLRAEGDILALMQLREDYELQRQEAQEHFRLERRNAQEDAAERLRQLQEDSQKRAAQIERDLQERRQRLEASYQEELLRLAENLDEQRRMIAENYAESLEEARRYRNEQLQELGQHLREQQNLTDTGMRRLAEILGTVFGEGGAGDALIQGWANRSTTAVRAAIIDIQNQILQLERLIEQVAATGTIPTAPGTQTSYGSYGLQRRTGRITMRQGGVGVVTGPALFEVEPGQREFYMFAPIDRLGRYVAVDAKVSGGIDIRGAHGASPEVVDSAVALTLSELREALRRLAGGRNL